MDHLKSYDEILGAFFAGPSGDETLDDTAGGSTAEETSHESGIAFDSVLIRSVYDTIREAAKENDEETISSTIMEIIEYPVSMEDAEKLEQIQMMLEKGEFEKMASVIDG